jgi:hypothetical protein
VLAASAGACEAVGSGVQQVGAARGAEEFDAVAGVALAVAAPEQPGLRAVRHVGHAGVGHVQQHDLCVGELLGNRGCACRFVP